MSAIVTALLDAILHPNDTKRINKAYLEVIKANFIVPVELVGEGEEPRVLFLHESEGIFLPVFTDDIYLDGWAKGIAEHINVLRMSGIDLLKGLGNDVSVCLDIGAPHFKIFYPPEMNRLKSMVSKIFQ